MNKIRDYYSTVVNNTLIDNNIYLLEMFLPGFNGMAEPGQFVMIKVNETYDPFLRRPYSILECSKEKMKFLIKIVGKGSKMIAHKKMNDKFNILGPLGVGFRVNSNRYPVLVAGGMGIAPLWFLAKRLNSQKKKFSIIYGERSASSLGDKIKKTFKKKVLLVTDDGSRGLKSTATGALSAFLDNITYKKVVLFSCGPPGMLKEITNFGIKRKIPVSISLEERMGCGIGVCLGCSVKRKNTDGFLTVCKDGPVFRAEEVSI